MVAQNRTFSLVNLLDFFCLLIFALISNTTLVPICQAQDKYKTAVADAEIMYDSGHFTHAIELLTRCLPDGVPDVQRIAAYRLLALSCLVEDYRDEAKEAIKKIFDHNRDYKPDLVIDPKQYRDMVEEVRKELPVPFLEKIAGGKKKWFWIGGATAGAVAVMIFWPKKVEPNLPVPSELPKNQ